MSKPPISLGTLLFGLFDESGRAPDSSPLDPARLGSIKYALLMSRQRAMALPTYQVQTLAIGLNPPSSQDQANISALFLAARRELSRQLVAHVEGKP
jgi:hypothetical protein